MKGYDAETYGERWADIYDEWYDDAGEVEATVAFLREVAGAPDVGGPIVELGIGTGRLALGLAAAGYDIRGIDASAAMVDHLRAKPGGAAIPVTIGDMKAVPIPPRATDGSRTRIEPDASLERDAVIEPGPVRGEENEHGTGERCRGVFVATNTFFGLSTDADQRACLSRVVEVLEPGGWFVLAAFVPAADVRNGRGSDVGVRNIDADRVVLTADVYDAATQTMSGQFIDISGAGITLRPFHIRYLFPDQLDALANQVGLTLVERWEDWARAPFTPDSLAHVSVYRRA